ncbi:DUF7302 family protein [Bacillus toyonensis]|uniref:DUF7302 family protein n=1 Tax=Bacillus toyonensis TaxID=155322 RepID=UPI0015CF5521|nr:hypothetical protein [Bacillus toyonensis]
MKVKALVPCIDKLFNHVGDILEVDTEYGKHLVGIDYAESIEEKKAPVKKAAPKKTKE